MATLQGKTALVTGASRGIGRAIASALANAGAHVLVHYGRSAQDAESLVAGIRSELLRIAHVSREKGYEAVPITDYKIENDLNIVWKCWRMLGGK